LNPTIVNAQQTDVETAKQS